MENKKSLNCQLAVIGAGMAGIASAAFARHRDINTVLIGDNAEISFASGCLDFLGTNPSGNESNFFESPLNSLDSFLSSNPGHPYGKVSKDSIKSAFNEFAGFMSSVNLPYFNEYNKNQFIITPAGTLKPTYCIPSSMIGASNAVKEKNKILIVDIKGLKGFSHVQIVENLKKYGIDAFGASISFPGKEDFFELNCERMAWDLEMGTAFDLFVERIKEVLSDAKSIGLPAILGIYNSESLRLKLEKELGVTVFEIPTFSPSVTGLRIKEKTAEGLKNQGVETFLNTKVKTFERREDSKFVFTVKRGISDYEIVADNVILATGRFFGRGLSAVKGRIYESLFDLYVAQPQSRNLWFSTDFFSPRGHLVNRCGLITDEYFRPLNEKHIVAYDNLFAAGSIISGQDWKREKSGAGISIVTAYKAVCSIAEGLCCCSDCYDNNVLKSENAA